MVVWSVGGPLILAIGASTLGWLLVRAAGATNEVAVGASGVAGSGSFILAKWFGWKV